MTMLAASTSSSEMMLRRRRILRAMKSGPEGRAGRNGLMGSTVIVKASVRFRRVIGKSNQSEESKMGDEIVDLRRRRMFFRAGAVAR